jgi:GT2 family glycosyltransferase
VILPVGYNSGFARGVNHGLRWILARREHDVIAFLNNDAEIDGAMLEKAAGSLRSNPKAGLLTGKIVTQRGDIWYGGGDLSLLSGTARISGQGQPDSGQCDRPRSVTFSTLAFSLCPRAVVEQVGLLAEEYFFGQEEWDYSMRVRRAGYELLYDPTIVCVHGGDGSHNNSAPEFIYNGYRNKLIFQQTYLPPLLFRVWRVAFRLYALTVLPYRVRRIHQGQLTTPLLRLCAREALRDQGSNKVAVSAEDLERFRALADAGGLPNRGLSRLSGSS